MSEACHHCHKTHLNHSRTRLWKVIVALILAVISMIGAMPHKFGIEMSQYFVWVSAAATLLILFISGLHFLKSIPQLFRSANMNTLIGISIVAALGFSFWNIFNGKADEVYFDTAAFIMAFVLLGQWIESLVNNRVRKYLSQLSELLPQQARKIIDGHEQLVSLSQLKEGDQIRILVGEKIPADATLLSDGSFDFSIISGESAAVVLSKGARVLQGAVNLGQPIEAKVLKAASESYYESLVNSVNESLESKPALQRRVDLWATWFVPLVVILSIACFLFWQDKTIAWSAALSVLVIACPCAVGLATPTAFLVGAIRAARRGVLIKSLEAIEKVSDIDLIAFDKTGTLTLGRPVLKRMKAVEHFSHRDLLQYASSIEKTSEHPYAQAIIEKAKEDKIETINAKNINIAPGKGVGGTIIVDGKDKLVFVGNLVWLFENGFDSTKVPPELTWEAEGAHETILWVGVDSKICGLLMLEDELRPEAKDVLQILSQEGYQVGMVTGDSENVARAFAKTLKLKFYHAGVLPDEKATIVKRLMEPKKKALDLIQEHVAFVGDGVNDAPALAAAHVGFAMGSGAAISQISSDIILVSNKLTTLPEALKVMKQTKSLIWQNLSLSFIYNILALPVAAGILYKQYGFFIHPEWAALAMGTSSILVLLNSLRALTFDKRPKMIQV